MKIGEVAALTGLPAKTIRYYEQTGLVRSATRELNGYRVYEERDLHVLRFLKRARSLGFSVGDCRELLALYNDKGRSSADVKRIARDRIERIEKKISELQQMRHALQELARLCHGDQRPECPIIDELTLENENE